MIIVLAACVVLMPYFQASIPSRRAKIHASGFRWPPVAAAGYQRLLSLHRDHESYLAVCSIDNE